MARSYAAASAAALSLLLVQTAYAQTYHDVGGTAAPGVVPVGGDGSGPLFTTSNPGKVSGVFSASVSGFTPTPSYSYQSVTTSSAAYPLPVGSGSGFLQHGLKPHHNQARRLKRERRGGTGRCNPAKLVDGLHRSVHPPSMLSWEMGARRRSSCREGLGCPPAARAADRRAEGGR